VALLGLGHPLDGLAERRLPARGLERDGHERADRGDRLGRDQRREAAEDASLA